MGKRSPAALDELYGRIGYVFSDESLLDRALTHASHGTSDRQKHYERLEFLGDRVLGLVAAEELYRRFPRAGEGDLSRRLNLLVRQESCTEVAQHLRLGEHIRWGKRTGGLAQNPRVLADACEAVMAAIYLDGGIEAARSFFLEHWEDFLERAAKAGKDPKTALQEWALARGMPVPAYFEEARHGPDHLPLFVMTVEVEGCEPATGKGPTKRSAEQNAAEAFLLRQGVWQT
jgi:ribonuclease-3